MSSLLPEDLFALLEPRLSHEADVAALTSLTREITPADYAALASAIDESDYSIADWLEALLTFESWLEQRAVPTRPFAAIMGYIHCCTLMNARGVITPSLNIIVNKALIDFGFDASQPSHV